MQPLDEQNHERPAGSLAYHTSAPRLSEMLKEAASINRRELSKAFSKPTSAITEALDALHGLASQHAWTFSSGVCTDINPVHDVLFACFHKTLLNLYAANELTLTGLYGLARPHLRQSFESMMIAKYCSCDPNSDLFDKWIDGVDVYFTNSVLKKLARPAIDQFQESWKLLCQWSHATVYASQISLDLATTRDQSGINFAFIGAIIEFVDHLLNRHLLSPGMRYYANRYGDANLTLTARGRLRGALIELRSIRGPATKRLVKDYRARWLVRAS